MRVQAVVGLRWLQDGSNSECPVITTLLDLLRKDSSPEVRRIVLNIITITDNTLGGTYMHYNVHRFGHIHTLLCMLLMLMYSGVCVL